MSEKHEGGILSAIKGIFGSDKNHDGTPDVVENVKNAVAGSDIGKEILSKLNGITSLDGDQIKSVLTALGQSADHKVQSAKADLETVKDDGASFVTKLKGYLTSIEGLLPTLLPTLKNILGAK